MPQPFHSTLRAVETQTFRLWSGLVIITLVVLAAWAVWFTVARVPVFARSTAARLEIIEPVHPVQSPIAARLIAIKVAVNQSVAAGDVLAELDSASQQLELATERTRLDALGPQIERLRSEIASARASIRQGLDRVATIKQAADARISEAEASATQAADEADRSERLNKQGLSPDSERVRTRSESDRRQAALKVARAERDRQLADYAGNQIELNARVERLSRDLAQLETLQPTEQALIQRLEHEVSERIIRAPIAGRVGQITERQPGEVVNVGEPIVALLPAGKLRAVAYFTTSEALGRIAAGQRARLRLDGFPWTQYGSLGMRVSQVDQESTAGRVRVQLDIDGAQNNRLTPSHGLPGVAEIEIERLSPFALVLRTAGRWLSDSEPAAPGNAAR